MRRCIVFEPLYTKNIYRILDAAHFLSPYGMRVLDKLDKDFMKRIGKGYSRRIIHIPAFFLMRQDGTRRISKLKSKIKI